ncbi:NRDE family protein [Salinisphaera aquimarina]|uniref:NRDE family protein n=1 Tax=Salinisphaera aquimarina TaxID=2094031 RepID=A0ABV7EPI5_9GAMM
MCLIAFAWQVAADRPLVVTANRDEFHARATAAAQWWDTPAGLFAGRDLEAGGAWCGMDRQGRFAAVTNVREPAAAGVRLSRGWLVRDYFASSESAAGWADRIPAGAQAYGPFNLLIGDLDTLWFVSNRGDVRRTRLRPGVHAISNGHWGDHWPKTERAQTRLRALIERDAFDAQAGFELLADADPAATETLPDTGIGPEHERFLSSLFIQSPRYGTRASTVITRRIDGRVDFHEHGFDADAAIDHRVHEHWLVATRTHGPKHYGPRQRKDRA